MAAKDRIRYVNAFSLALLVSCSPCIEEDDYAEIMMRLKSVSDHIDL